MYVLRVSFFSRCDFLFLKSGHKKLSLLKIVFLTKDSKIFIGPYPSVV